MKGSDLLVAALENEGVERIFGVPGEENLDVVESLRRSRINLIVTRHEQAAAFMAATHGRLTGKPGVCLATLGPGALNLTTGAAFALLGAMPMVMITGQKGILSRKQARFQVVDNQNGAADRQPCDHPLDRARRLSARPAGAARPRSSGASRGHRARNGARRPPRYAAPDRIPCSPRRRARPGRELDIAG
jgi:hypothetical protein